MCQNGRRREDIANVDVLTYHYWNLLSFSSLSHAVQKALVKLKAEYERKEGQ
jgi:hypothetical protein